MIGTVGTVAVMFNNFGSEMLRSFKALMTFFVGAVRACGGVRDASGRRGGGWGKPLAAGDTLAGGVFGKTAVERISGVIYFGSVLIGGMGRR